MRSLRSITLLLSLLTALLAGAQATPSAATSSVRQAAAADCTSETTHCMFLPWMRVPAFPPTFQPLGSVSGNISAVELSGAYAYIGRDNELLIIDVSDPLQPREVGTYQFQGLGLPSIVDIEVQPPLAYVSTFERVSSCCMDTRVYLLNVGQPAQPQLLASTSELGGADIEVVDQRVYAAGPRWSAPWPDLVIADVVGSSSLFRRGSYGNDGSWSVAVNGSIVYVTDNEHGILVIDAADPDSPKLLQAISTPHMPYSMDIDGSNLYVAMVNTLAVYDISTPQAPAVRSIREMLGFPADLEVANGWAYVGLSSVGLSILDVRNPEIPELVTSYPPPGQGQVNALEVDGSLLYLATSNGLHIVRVTAQ
ncbi:MAG TPA: hypothetical protein VGD69_12545 [Herpetosiphonaceae bacterium]